MTAPKGPERRLADRLRVLRIERGWSQVEVAQRAGTDGRQISRYENGHITPTIPVLVRLAEAFDVSIDYLLLPAAPRRPFHLADEPLLHRLTDLHRLPDPDRDCLLNVLEAMLARAEVKKPKDD